MLTCDKNIKGRLCEAHSMFESTQLAHLSRRHANTVRNDLIQFRCQSARADVEQTSSKHRGNMTHSLHEAIIKQTSSWLV